MLAKKTIQYSGSNYNIIHSVTTENCTVYFVKNKNNNRTLALKTYRFFAASKNIVTLLESEVSLWVKLGTLPNVVRCYGMEVINGIPFIAIEWIYTSKKPTYHVNLREYISDKALTFVDAMNFCIDVCWGLLHIQHICPGFMHLDIKPDNIVIYGNPTFAKLTDFGLARLSQNSVINMQGKNIAYKTSATIIDHKAYIGTPLYMSPEQWLGKPLSIQSDIYGLGCVLYEMLSGSPPYMSDSLDELKTMHLTYPIPSVTLKANEAEVNVVIRKCMAKKGVERYRTYKDLLDVMLKLCNKYSSDTFMFPRLIYGSRGEFQNIYHEYTERIYKDYRFTPVLDQTEKEFLMIGATEYVDLLNEAKTLFNLGKIDDSISKLNQAVEIQKEMQPAYILRGMIHSRNQNLNSAYDDFTTALSIDSTDVSVLRDRSNVLFDMGRYKEAIGDINKAIDLESDDYQSFNDRGYLYARLGKYEMAMKDLDRSISLNASNSQAFMNRGFTNILIGNNDGALSDYIQAVTCDSKNASAYVGCATCYLFMNEYDDAEACLLKAISLSPSDGSAHHNIGFIYYFRNLYEKAMPHFKIAFDQGYPISGSMMSSINNRSCPYLLYVQGREDDRYYEIGKEALSKTVFLIAAGGDSSRMQNKDAKNKVCNFMQPITPLSKKSSIYKIVESIVAISRYTQNESCLPIVIGVNPSNDEKIRTEIRKCNISPSTLSYIIQDEVPVLDAKGMFKLNDNRLLMTAPSGTFGVVNAFYKSSLFNEYRRLGKNMVVFWYANAAFVFGDLLRHLCQFIGNAVANRLEFSPLIIETDFVHKYLNLYHNYKSNQPIEENLHDMVESNIFMYLLSFDLIDKLCTDDKLEGRLVEKTYYVNGNAEKHFILERQVSEILRFV